MSQANQLNVKDKCPQSGAFPVGQTRWIKNGGKQPLPVKILESAEESETQLNNDLQQQQKQNSYNFVLFIASCRLNLD